MSEREPERRLRFGRARRADETPRVEGLDALLRQVDDLRLTLETDLTLAASAVEAGEPQLAADILDSDRAALRSFEQQALAELDDLGEAVPVRRARVAHAGPVLVAAALVGLFAGLAPSALAPTTSGTPETVAATDSLERLQALAEDGDTDEMRKASLALHRQLAHVVAKAKSDPAAAQTALLLLTYEQSAIVRSGDSHELMDVLRQSQALARAIAAALPASVRSAVPVAPVFVAAEPSREATPKPSASSTRSASPKPKPKPSASPTAQPSPSPSSTQDDDGPHLPSAPFQP